ncbi:MAG: site-2 protease family protein [Polyangiaceae bacterium]|nr:site-2 protease family protein [Polyangiaceae bacterium]
MPLDDLPRADGDPDTHAAGAALHDRDRRSSLPPRPLRWKKNLALFLATVVSVFLAGTLWNPDTPRSDDLIGLVRYLPYGWPFAVPLLSILLVHEFGHYFAARAHRVEASLPFFIPMPFLSPFGTMGAVISMKGRIRSRNALLDIGASGPLAGLVIALPVLIIGLMGSEVKPVTGSGIQEGQSLLYLALKRVVLGPIPPDHDVFLSPVALAGWTGLFVTSLNLIPIGQLDGGHIAYALFGTRQDRFARALHLGLLGMFLLNLARFLRPALASSEPGAVSQAVSNSMPWLIWFILITVMLRVGGRDHPPTETCELSPLRKGVAVLSLLLFVLLFMPTPWAAY